MTKKCQNLLAQYSKNVFKKIVLHFEKLPRNSIKIPKNSRILQKSQARKLNSSLLDILLSLIKIFFDFFDSDLFSGLTWAYFEANPGDFPELTQNLRNLKQNYGKFDLIWASFWPICESNWAKIFLFSRISASIYSKLPKIRRNFFVILFGEYRYHC